MTEPGVVIEDVSKSLPAQEVGLQEGDILLRWSRGDAKGEIGSPFDLLQIWVEQASQGPLTIEGFRKDEKRVWTMGGIYLGDFRPNLREPLLSSYHEGQTLIKAGKPLEAAKHWRADAEKVQESSPVWLSSWLLSRAAQELAKSHLWRESDDTYQQAIDHAKTAEPAIRAHLFEQWARSYENRYDWSNAEKCANQSLVEQRKSGNETLLVASRLFILGIHALNRGDLAASESYSLEALAIQEKLAPNSLLEAMGLGNVGAVSLGRGDLETAERYYRRALAIEEKLDLNSHNFAIDLKSLGLIASRRGDLTRAEKCYKRALVLFDAQSPDSADVAGVLNSLGEVRLQQGDPAGAEAYYKRALTISEKFGPVGLRLSLSLTNLGNAARARGNQAKADIYYQRALVMYEKIAPGTLDLAEILNHVGAIALRQGDTVKAERLYSRALAISEKLSLSTADHAESLVGLARAKAHQHKSDGAVQLYEQALNVLEDQIAHLGGGEEAGENFRVKYGGYYRDYIHLLVTQKNNVHAFGVLERLRARTLLESLAAAHVDIRQGVDPALVTQERSLRESINGKWNRRMQLFGKKDAQEPVAVFDTEISELLAQYKDVEQQIRTNSPAYAALTQPRPLRADEVQQQLLDNNTLLLEYSLGTERSYVFAVTRDSLDVYPLPKRAEIERVAHQVYELLTRRDREANPKTQSSKPAPADKVGSRNARAVADLSRMVLAPISAQLQGRRLLIVSDGALQYVPFAVLPLPGKQIPLVAEHEIVNLPSASVLAELRRREADHKPGAKAVAVLADPVFADHDDRVSLASLQKQPDFRPVIATPVLPAVVPDLPDEPGELERSAQEIGISGFSRLPFTRREADVISSIAGQDDALEALDFDASKATALSQQLKDYRIVHFATHGLLNNDHPELSGLVFSLVDRQGQPQDGFLRMLDIYNMELNADLVVLSACQTALGKEVSEEGLIGLTRGFMYAGAPRVVASLWKVDDEATAALMYKFYDGMLRDHLTAAQALRSAQRWMQTQKSWQSPYYWAGFVLQGEWK